VGKRGEFWLDKANDAFQPFRLDASRDWTLWGTVTRIVDAPVFPRRRQSSAKPSGTDVNRT